MVVYDSPTKRKSWDHHGVRVFYIFPSLSSTIVAIMSLFPRQEATRISDTLDHFPDSLFPFEDPASDPVMPDPTSFLPSQPRVRRHIPGR